MDIEKIGLLQEPLCLSGGADGADLQWGMNAGKNGHTVIHWSFDGHDTLAPEQEVCRLKSEQLEEADPHLEQANKVLQRTVPYDKYYVVNMLRRNYYQIRWTDLVYAVTSLDENGKVFGGTAWATQMFVGMNKPENNMFVFDQTTDKWLVWVGVNNDGSPILEEIQNVPVPGGIWAGIGARDLKENGKNAIRNLFK